MNALALTAPSGPQRPKAVLLDVNQTLFSLEPLRQRFRDVGLHGPQALEVALYWHFVLQLPAQPSHSVFHFQALAGCATSPVASFI